MTDGRFSPREFVEYEFADTVFSKPPLADNAPAESVVLERKIASVAHAGQPKAAEWSHVP
jgi:hypothetical protein